jgi:plastocyanin
MHWRSSIRHSDSQDPNNKDMTMMNVRTRLYALLIASALGTMPALRAQNAAAGQETRTPKPIAVDIDNFKFGIISADVAAGTTVTWTNRDDVPHTVVSLKKVFKSPPLDTGESFSYTFKDAGTFEYYCSLHPRMTGKIVVK